VTGHRGGVSPLQNERRDFKSTALGKEEMVYAYRLFGMNSFKEGVI
jgi:hypothetical protein